MSTPFWFNDPTILFKKNYILQLWPLTNMDTEQKVNAITRLVIILTFLGYIYTYSLKILVTGFVTLVAIIVLYKVLLNKSKNMANNKAKNTMKETFQNLHLGNSNKFNDNYTTPTNTNPSMNVLLPEIQDNPNRTEAAPAYNKNIVNNINDSAKNFIKQQFDDQTIDCKLFNDLGDHLQFEQSMRTWNATSNTTIPNDQKSFAEFCYGDMSSHKEGGRSNSI